MTTNDTQARRTLGQIAHEAGERAGRWERKWKHLSSAQKIEWEEIADVVAEHVRAAALASRQDQQGQAVAWEATTPVYKQFVTQAWYDKARPAVKRWYKPYRCSACAAPSLPVGKEPTP